MRYVVILKKNNVENPVFEADDITRCFRWIVDQARNDPEISKENYWVADRDFEQSSNWAKERDFRTNRP